MNGILTIDGHYIAPERASVYLIVEGERATFVDTNTVHAVPRMMAALEAAGLTPDQVDYVIVTHVHLDHAGGASELLRCCPNATALVHPKTARHLAKPDRLIQAARMIYHERFDELYGEILPVDESRMRIMADGEVLRWGRRDLTFFHTLGHATHHFCIHDSGSGAVFTGDSFGIAYPALQDGDRPFIFAAATPTEFDPGHSRDAVERILSYRPSRVYLGHFGGFDRVDALAEELMRTIDGCDAIIAEAARTPLADGELRMFIQERVEAFTHDELRHCSLPVDDDTLMWVNPDIMLNTQGLVAAVAKRRRHGDGSA